MPIPLRIKICGVTTAADIHVCNEAGADAVGINFHPGSSRYVDPSRAQLLMRSMPPLMTPVGVFVGQPLRQVCDVAAKLGLRGVQCHGDNHEIADPFPFSLIRAFRIRDRRSLDDILAYLDQCSAELKPAAILVDAFVEGQEGGTGKKAPWDLLADFKPSVPLILAGGLTPANVGEAIAAVRPAAVDVASGVEIAPGRKDPAKVYQFVANAREAAARL